MNGKKAKSIRRKLKELGVDVKSCFYKTDYNNNLSSLADSLSYNSTIMTVRLVIGCGRQIYKQEKLIK